jgi:hypothetical protein
MKEFMDEMNEEMERSKELKQNLMQKRGAL